VEVEEVADLGHVLAVGLQFGEDDLAASSGSLASVRATASQDR